MGYQKEGKMRKKSFFWSVYTAVALSYIIGYANIIPIPEPDYPLHGIGFGTRAIGMGGAFVAIADDPSAIWWNPAGLSKIDKLSIYGEMSYLYEEGELPYGYYYGPYDSGDRYTSYSKGTFLPRAVVLTIPYRDIGIGIGAYVPYCTIKEDGEFTWKDEKIIPAEKGKVRRVEIAIASGKNSAFNLGLTIGYQWLTTEERSFYHKVYDGTESVHWYKEEFEGKGFSASIGGIWKVSGNSSIGITMGTHTPLKGEKKYQNYYYHSRHDTVYRDTTYIGETEEERSLPKFVRLGAFIENEKGTIIAVQIDFLRRDYYPYVYPAGWYEPLFGLGEAQLSLGIEQSMNESIALRAGVYSSPKGSYYNGDVFTFTSGFTVKCRSFRFEGVIENMLGGDDKVRIGSISVIYEWL